MARQDLESRRSTAAQFFMEEELEESEPSYKTIINLLNEAAVSTDSSKTDNLRKVQEIIIYKEPSLLDNFLDEMLGFQSDRSADVRKFVIGFIEEACKKDPDVLPRVVGNLQIFLQDNSAAVQKRVIQAASHLYRSALAWLAHARTITDDMENAWGVLSEIKTQITKMVDSDNDGIRTLSVKFLESVILLQTYPEEDSMRRDNDFSLEDIPLTLKIARRRKLEEEANMIFDLLVKFHGSAHISSVNLMICMGTLSLIAKMRPQFMGKVVVALEMLHTNLPPTLSNSQVSSVRKHLKLQLFSLLKHPASIDYQTNITTLLTDLGASYQEIMKSLPKSEDVRKRKKREERYAQARKPSPIGLEEEEEDDDEDEEEDEDFDFTRSKRKRPDAAVDITERFVGERLNPELAAQLVILAMSKLPEKIPAHFSSTYTPIAAAGTSGQIKHVARLIASQLTASGLGPGVKQCKKDSSRKSYAEDDEDDEDIPKPSEAKRRKKEEVAVVAAIPTPPSTAKVTRTQRIKTLKLSEITKPFEGEERERMAKEAVGRILKAERCSLQGGVALIRNKILTVIASQFDDKVGKGIRDFILDDLKNRSDLAFAWLYEEYSFMQGFSRMPTFLRSQINPPESYNTLLCGLIQTLMEKPDAKEKETLMSRLYLEAPLITEEATELLRHLCGDPSRAAMGLALLQELILRRPPRQLTYLNLLLVYTAHERSEIRNRAIQGVVELYGRGDLRSIIEEYAIFYLGFLRLPQPPDVLFGEDRGRPKVDIHWNEEIVKACLYLYLVLLPINEELIHELARVYVQTVADVKRVILRLLEQPVRGMGMDSPQLLTLVEECPKGAETLVTRVIHILTDKTPPSIELVARVRDLYHTRVSDVRFLIPVLNGLTKKEVMAALPRLIKLNPVVVKEVFNRLLGTHSEGSSYTSPLTPAELLIALHNVDPSKADMKTIIKATSQCFGEKQVYTQEVLAVVMQQLMEQSPLPTLLMRTVIQSLSLYPRLIGFVMNILQRLILKQVWKQKKVWEGFIKCCQRTKPQSFQVLLQLPPAQLMDVFINSPDLQPPLQAHVMSLTENQRAHIPQAVMDVLMGTSREQIDELDAEMEPVSPAELTIDVRDENEDSPVPGSEPGPPGDD